MIFRITPHEANHFIELFFEKNCKNFMNSKLTQIVKELGTASIEIKNEFLLNHFEVTLV